jgi:NhaP-type Na+/H+ or K+/H+ antiporter
MHVAGESIMNDGSASVFYAIFGLRFLYEMGIPGVGEHVGWEKGFEIFFRLSLGGACIGIIFGFGALIITYNLNRRLSGEDSLYQAVATISIAYLSFFTAEILAHCSGFLAVVFCGVTVKAFGETLYNDTPMSVSFWHITEKLLNTLVFALGGCVWGNIISGPGGSGLFRAKDWVR